MSAFTEADNVAQKCRDIFLGFKTMFCIALAIQLSENSHINLMQKTWVMIWFSTHLTEVKKKNVKISWCKIYDFVKIISFILKVTMYTRNHHIFLMQQSENIFHLIYIIYGLFSCLLFLLLEFTNNNRHSREMKKGKKDDILLMLRNRYFKAFKFNWVLYNFKLKGLII